MRAGFISARRQLFFFCLALGLGLTGACAMLVDESPPRISFYRDLHTADVSMAWLALQETLETRMSAQTGTWHNAATGNTGSVTPLRTFRIASGTYCREFHETATRSGAAVKRRATACRNGNGAWIPVVR